MKNIKYFLLILLILQFVNGGYFPTSSQPHKEDPSILEECQKECNQTKKQCYQLCRQQYQQDNEKFTCQDNCKQTKESCLQKCESDKKQRELKEMQKKSCMDEMLECAKEKSRFVGIEQALKECKTIKEKCEATGEENQDREESHSKEDNIANNIDDDDDDDEDEYKLEL